jgi:hypothetical protein
MKILILAVLLLAMGIVQNASANIAFEVKGQLEVNTDKRSYIGTERGTLEVTSIMESEKSCSFGRFLVVTNYFPQETFTLIEVLNCYDTSLNKLDQIKSINSRKLDILEKKFY